MVISIITANKNQEFIQLLEKYNVVCLVTKSIPKKIELWPNTPETIVVDSTIATNWKQQIMSLKELNMYKDIPVIVLTNKLLALEDLISAKEKEFLLFHNQDALAIVSAIFGTTTYWRKLNNERTKINQLNRMLSINQISMSAKQIFMEKSKKTIVTLTEIANDEVKIPLIKLKNEINGYLNSNDYYELFKAHFEEVHPLFYKKLLFVNPNLSNNDLKLAGLLKMGFTNSEMVYFLGISLEGVKKALQRLRKRLMLTPDQSVRKFIFNLEV